MPTKKQINRSADPRGARRSAHVVALLVAHSLSGAVQDQPTPGPGTPEGQPTRDPSTPVPATNAPIRLEPTVVTGSAEVVSLPKFTESIRDTPQSISVITRQEMTEQGIATLRDALRNVAGLSLAAGEGGSQGDNLTLRGFTARNDIFLDGMRDFGSYYRDSFNYDQVEVLKGPESVVFGRGSTGGVVNQREKSPELSSFVAGSFGLGTDLTRRATLDINEAVPAFGNGTAFRLNLMGHESDFAGRDIAENRRFGVAPSLAFGISSSTRMTLSYLHQSEDDIPDYGIPWLFNGPAPVERHNFYGFRSDYLRTDVDVGTIKLEHDVSSELTLRDQIRYANYSRDARITEPQATQTTAGPAPTLGTPLDEVVIHRNEITVNSVETFFQNQFDATLHLDTGPITHAVVGGIEAGRETSDPTRYSWTGVPATGLLTPNEGQEFAGVGAVSSKVRTTADSVAIYAIDTVKLSESWSVMGGFRWDYFDANYANSVASQTFDRIDELPSWRAGIVYKPLPHGSVYFDYGTSFNPSAETLALSAGNANLPPEENETFELGSKWDLISDALTLRGALFRTVKTNARETSPTNSAEITLSGNQRVDGAELEISAHVSAHWKVSANYALLDSEVISSQVYPGSVGSQLANAPRHTVNLWTTWELPWRLEVGGGINYVDSRTASSTVPRDPVTGLVKEVPDYWKLDAVLKYQVSQSLDLQINVYNLTDKYYYDQIHPAHIIPGAGRSALFTVHFRF